MPFTKNNTIDRSNPNYSGLRIIVIFMLSSGMMYLDFQGNYTDRLRSYLSVAVLPIQVAANAPKKIINNYYSSIFPWLKRCEKIFGFDIKGYGKVRIYGFLAERYLSYWFHKYTKPLLWPVIFYDTSKK